MGEKSQNNQDSFERYYNRHKGDGLRLTETERVLSDRVITQYLRKNFNEESGIPMDRIDLDVIGGVTDIEQIIAAANEKNWNPNYSEGFVSETVKNVMAYFSTPEPKTPEQVLSDQNAENYLLGNSQDKAVVDNIISHVPSLVGFSLEDAKTIARADIAGVSGSTDIDEKFPAADRNLIRSVAYSMLYVNRDEIKDSDLQDQDFSEMARGYMHYAHEDSEAFSVWEMDRRIDIIDAITNNPEIMADMALIRAPKNIETAGDLHAQFKIRERIADGIAVAAAKTYGMSDTLNGDDVHVVYKSKADLEKDGTLGYMGAGTSGILNDEFVIIRYNPAYFLMERAPELTQTDHEEVSFFIKTVVEEVQHAVDQIQTDRLVLGMLPEDAPLEHHATMAALNRVTYADRGDYKEHADYHEAYRTQYMEKTAKAIADDVAFEVVYAMENPEENNKILDGVSDDLTQVTDQPAISSGAFKI
ncbi:MAG: hypothetical protein COA45_01810 [Zetaproteobacteria bacterium]|nr:MAG: hypothetical protein COA45_01810 [Zetaproteobacteria bacterium]